MLRLILKQMYVPSNYTTKDFRSQIGAFMAREVHYFFPRMSEYLSNKELTYEAYITGVSLGDISADQYMILTVSRKQNVECFHLNIIPRIQCHLEPISQIQKSECCDHWKR